MKPYPFCGRSPRRNKPSALRRIVVDPSSMDIVKVPSAVRLVTARRPHWARTKLMARHGMEMAVP